MDTRAVVLNFEHSDFDIVSDFGFRYSDFHDACFISVFINILNSQNRVQNSVASQILSKTKRKGDI